jgi:hypothetical protein
MLKKEIRENERDVGENGGRECGSAEYHKKVATEI